ncbi:unnamed protein product [Ceratitis capitata]|uniref:(Mediterranean fruit fly) hypothetical protein n=1 Tax=Ceratitis capitata TaxID=7213 RepID=A0A811UUA5_CERCA|nr:unnamed protein product [Ceratitis capitata]
MALNKRLGLARWFVCVAQPVFGVSIGVGVGVVWSLATHNGIHMELDTCTHAGKVMAHVVLLAEANNSNNNINNNNKHSK